MSSMRFRDLENIELYVEKFKRVADLFRSLGGDHLSVKEEMELFCTLLPSFYDNVRDWFPLLKKQDQTYESLKRKCIEKYKYAKRDAETSDRDREKSQCLNVNSSNKN